MNTVIIRSKNEQRYIGYCIQSVTDFIGKPKIVLIDNEPQQSKRRFLGC